MRILFVHQNFPGQFRHLAPALAAQAENQVVALGDETNIRAAAGLHPRLGLCGYPAPAGASAQTHHYLHSTESAIRRGQAVARAAMTLRDKGFSPDVIYAHPAWGEALYLKDIFPSAKLLLFLEFFYRPHGSDMNFDPEYPNSFDDGCKARTRNATQLLSLACADGGISPTHWQRAQYPREFQGMIHVVHDGIDTDVVRPGVVADFRLPDDRGQLASGAEVITFVARNLEPYRGFHTFMRALPTILAARPHAHVLIVGGDDVSYGRRLEGESYRAKYMRESDGRLDSRRIHFLGKIPYSVFLDVLRLSSAHVYLTYPFVLSWSMLEAMSSGCLVIGSDTPPVREVIVHGRNGILVDFFSATDLAAAVVDALAHPQSVKPLRDQARGHILARYDLTRIALPQQTAIIDELTQAGWTEKTR